MGIQPVISRLMAFVDGENLVARYQAMVKDGRVPRPSVVHETDVFVWNPNIELIRHWELIRAHYCASVVGDDNKVATVRDTLRRTVFVHDSFNSPFAWCYPIVFKKPAKSKKASVVDIRLTTDVLSHVYQNNVDVVLFLSGDADFEPVVRDVIARGKQAVVAGFSSGMSESLSTIADRYQYLDDCFFSDTPAKPPARIADPFPLLRVT
jgi:uncharacterized LabA/DUF88 family protein